MARWIRGLMSLMSMVLVLALTLTVLATVALAQDTPPDMPQTVEDLVPADGALLGAWAKPRGGYTPDLQRQAFTTVEDLAGRTLDIAQSFYRFDRSLPTWRESWHLSEGRTPMISWNGTDTDDIVAGIHDSHIRDQARGVAALGAPVFLRFFWEMDANGTRGEMVGSPERYIAAWRHVHDIFTAEGVDNAAWVWCPNALAFTTGEAPTFYPGDAYVDWTCADGYNWAEAREGARWRDLGEIFADFHAWGAEIGKPMMIGETGVVERESGEKADWLREVPTILAEELPGIRAIVYFHSDSKYPWWLDSSSSSASAFRQMAGSDYMTQTPVPVRGQDQDARSDELPGRPTRVGRWS